MAFTGVIQGVRSSQSYPATQVRPDIELELALLKPYRTPIAQFLLFSKGAKQIEVKNKLGEHDWFEDEFFPYQTTVVSNFAGGSSTGTIYLTDYTYLIANSIILLESSGTMAYVTTTPSSTAVAISSLDGSTALGSAAAGSYVKIFTEMANEYGATPTALSTESIKEFNLLNIFTKSVSTTGRDEAGLAWTDGTSHDEQVEKKIEEMKFSYERAILLSNNSPVSRTVSIGGRSYLWTWGEGLIHRIQTNVIPYTQGAMTETVWNNYIAQVMEKGSDFRIHYAGTKQITDINAWIGAKVQLKDNVTHEYGVQATRLHTNTGGTVDIVWDPVLDGAYTSYGFTIDPDKMACLYMANDKKGSRKYRIEPNVELPGDDGTTTKILMDVGYRLENEETCGILHG
jgi:Family of unknown function (DUF5309)